MPRSGSRTSSSANTQVIAPSGRHSSLRVRGAFRRERYAAAQIASASFASSDGWKTAGPNEIQRRAPLIGGPTTSTATSRTNDTSTSIGASDFSRR